MTKPRCVLPGTMHLITRRCSERRFFLRPDPHVKQIFEYLLALASKAHKIEIHAYVVMSNHYHLVVTDTEGRLPNFQRELNSLIARSINAFRGRKESFWDRKSYNAVALEDDDDVLTRMAYTLANPVAARLVNRARQWEGATSSGMAFGTSRKIARPLSKFFTERMPATVELELTRPKCKTALTDDRLQQAIEEEVAKREKKCMELGKAMGMARVRAQHWNSSPDTIEPPRAPQATTAGQTKSKREAIERAKEWLRHYKDALAQFIEGNRDVEFPPGTWWMCERFRCNRALA